MNFFRLLLCQVPTEAEIEAFTLEWEGLWFPVASLPGLVNPFGAITADNYELEVDSETTIEKSMMSIEAIEKANEIIGRPVKSILEVNLVGRGEGSSRFKQIVQQLLERFDGYVLNDNIYVINTITQDLPGHRVIMGDDIY